MDRDLGVDAGDRRVEPPRHVVHAAGVHAVVRLVDLDEVGAGGDQRPALGVDERHQIGQQRGLVPIGATELERHHQRGGAGHGGLESLAGERAGEPELVDDAQPLRGADLLDHLERRVGVPQRLPELARRLQRANAGEAIVKADARKQLM